MKELWLANGLTGELGSQLKKIFESSPSIELRPLDLRQETSAQRILHIAARRPVHSFTEQMRSNVFYLRQVLAYAKASKIPEFVFFSSASLYSASSKNALSENDVRFKWSDTYSWTKWIGEKMVAQSRIPSRLILRLPAVLELKGATNFISRAFLAVQQRQALKASYLDQPFNRLLNAEDIAQFLQKASRTREPGLHILNLAPPATHSLRETLWTLSTSLGGRAVNIAETPSTSAHSIIDVTRLKESYHYSLGDSQDMIRRWVEKRKSLS